MRKILPHSGLLFMLFLISMAAVAQQPTLEWAKRFDGTTTANASDQAVAIAVDDAGNSYITGISQENGIQGIAIVKYAPSGQQLWAVQYEENATATDIAVDNTGGVYVTGSSNNDYLTIRYKAATGEQVWVKQYDGGGADAATDIVIDNTGGVYVTGNSSGEYATVRYNAATGAQVWVQRHVGDRFDRAATLATDNAGGVYMAGTSNGDYFTISYNATTGEQVWEQHYDGPGGIDIVSAIAVDNTGGVYITGSSLNNASDYVTIRYNAETGERSWVQLYGATQDSDDQAMDLAVDINGGVYVTGFSIGQTSTYNYATVRYTASTGEQSWVQQYDGGAPVSASDYTVALAVDAEGNSYVTGTSVGDVSVHITTAKYAPSGEELWAVQMEENSEAAAIAVDKTGGVYVTGSIAGRMGNYYVTIRYDAATGEETWVSYYYGIGGPTSPVAIAVDDTGGIYVTGSSSNFSVIHTGYATVRYNAATGEETWSSTYYSSGSGPSFATAIAVDGTGGVYVTGSSFENRNGFSDYATVRYEAATGEETWVQRYNGPGEMNDFARAIAVDNDGGVYVTGYTTGIDNGIDYATVRYDAASGAQTWNRLYNGPNNTSDLATAIAADNTGGVYVTGTSNDNSSSDYATLRYEAATGEEVWVQRYKSSGSSFERAAAIAVDNTGGVYVTGYSSSDGSLEASEYATVRYDATTGEQIWAEHYAESVDNVDVAVDVAVDRMGNVIVTGYSYGGPVTNYDFLTIKYSQQAQCPDITEAVINGVTAARAGTTGSVFSLPNTGASSFSWMITDSQGNPYTNFTGQGTSSINVNWPSAPDFFKVSVSTGGPGGGCVVSTSVTYVRIFDPDAGFVTGGGWIESPANSAYEFMQTSKRAHWSLVARYSERDETQVQGSTMLLLQAGSFTFRSTSYEAGSLVIIGNRAYYSGRGTATFREGPGRPVKDDRQFGFMVSATDGDLGANSGPDKFRLTIWVINADGTQGPVVYDSQAGCMSDYMDANAEACTAIGGGNITIHKLKVKNAEKKHALSAGATPEGHSLSVYPTSVSDRATLSFMLENAGDYVLEVYDMKGALVKRIAAGTAKAGKHYDHSLSIEGMSKGLYLVRLSTRDKVQTVKLVVQQ